MAEHQAENTGAQLKQPRGNRKYLYAGILLGALFLPILFWVWDLPVISSSLGKTYELIELFGFFASLALIFIAYLILRKRKKASFNKLLPFLLFICVGFYFLFLITEFTVKSWDYLCYERAAKEITQGNNPYGDKLAYLYPPLPAQVMAVMSVAIERGIPLPQIDAETSDKWNLVFYFYQCCQYLLILLAGYLAYKFLRRGGLQPPLASIVVTVLLVFNNPLIRTIKYNQMNLWILALLLMALIFYRRRPVLAGIALAFAAHIKLYPLILFIPLILTRQFRAVLWGVIGFAGIFLVQTNFLRDTTLWGQFLDFFRSFPAGTGFFRDNSLHSIAYNIYHLIRGVERPDLHVVNTGVQAVIIAVSVLIIGWFVIRFIQREKAFQSYVRDPGHAEDKTTGHSLRVQGHMVDAIALALIVSPMVWEHHYILAIPVILLAIVVLGTRMPWQVGLCAFLMLGLPTFDFFPFSYHRIVGLVLLLSYLTPSSIFSGIGEPVHK